MNSNVSDYTTKMCYKMMAGVQKDHHSIFDPKKEQIFHFLEASKFHFIKHPHQLYGKDYILYLNLTTNLTILVPLYILI